MKHSFFVLFFLIWNNIFSQIDTTKHLEITGSFLYFKILGHHFDYGLNISSSRDSSKFSNEIALFVSKINAFKEFNVLINVDHFTVGKAFNLRYKSFYFKPSINFGAYYSDFRGFGGFQYELGLCANPRIQVGFHIKRYKVRLTSNYTFNYGWMRYTNNLGEDVNSNIWFPTNFKMNLNAYLSISYLIKFVFLMINFNTVAQTNLICNGSFETDDFKNKKK